ncbi:hypothetical protein [Aquimarina sp. RZ0]|uniref:hypothetical protein n=1 Tax=Aquimarina sp. RZ0 TaxID=2607730 RepID=UPI0011F300D7|nr:hypothetical protein [Aquimarina sp. RZ0]KAA1246480.1 hypothetical protein F0000_07685 [Aquimarina sp. RZ0]
MKTCFELPIYIVLFSVILTGCSENELQSPPEVSETENLTYHFKGEIFTERELVEAYHSDILYNTDWFIESKDHAFLFDNKECRDEYASENTAKMNDTQLTLFESSRLRGRSIRVCGKHKFQNLNTFWRNRVRSAKISNVVVNVFVTFYDKLNFKGQKKGFLIKRNAAVGIFGKGTVLDGFKARAESFRIGR